MNDKLSSNDTNPLSQEILDNARIIWSYQALYEKPEQSDFVIATGHDSRLPAEAIRLFKNGYAQYFVASGGHLYGEMRNFNSKDKDKTEAEVFKNRAIEQGIPENKILLQNKSRNMGEVFLYTKQIFSQLQIPVKRGIFIFEPDKQRRGKASLQKQWPEIETIVTSVQITMDQYANEEIPMPKLIQQIVENMTKIIEYPKKGFMQEQYILDNVMRAYNELLTHPL